MQKWEYAFIVLQDNQFIFYEPNHEPRLLFQTKKPSIINISNKLDTDFEQTLVKAINKVAEEGWELAFIGSGVIVWYFKRPIKG